MFMLFNRDLFCMDVVSVADETWPLFIVLGFLCRVAGV